MMEFREMRRKRQQLAEEESIAILEKATAGTLALLGDNDYPYAVPISYVYHEGKLYFHSALAGHKVDAIHKCDKASFCVIEKDDIQPEKYTTFFRSTRSWKQPECSATVTIRIRTMPCRKRLKAACLVCWPSALTSSI